MTGLHRGQLAGPLADDDLLSRFVRIFEDIGTPLYDFPSDFPAVFDPRIAPDDIARWLGRWLGLAVDETLPSSRLHRLVSAAGDHYGVRGSAETITALLGAMTGGDVVVDDPGAIVREGQSEPGDLVPPLVVHLDTRGDVPIGTITAYLRSEIPAWLRFEVHIADEGPDDRVVDAGDGVADA